MICQIPNPGILVKQVVPDLPPCCFVNAMPCPFQRLTSSFDGTKKSCCLPDEEKDLTICPVVLQKEELPNQV